MRGVLHRVLGVLHRGTQGSSTALLHATVLACAHTFGLAKHEGPPICARTPAPFPGRTPAGRRGLCAAATATAAVLQQHRQHPTEPPLSTCFHTLTCTHTHTHTSGHRRMHTRHTRSAWRTGRMYCFPQVGRGGAVSGIGLCRFYPCSALSPPVHAYHLPRVYTSSLVSYTHVSSIDPGLTIVPGPCPYQALRVSLRVAS